MDDKLFKWMNFFHVNEFIHRIDAVCDVLSVFLKRVVEDSRVCQGIVSKIQICCKNGDFG
jgi:hypothetical protein